MSDTRITRPRKIFSEFLGRYSKITFSQLKTSLVGKGEDQMNLATLYRIIETFKNQHLIHEIEIAGERVIFACTAPHTTDRDAISIHFCENCGSIIDEHEPLPQNYTKKLTFAQTQSCKNCVLL